MQTSPGGVHYQLLRPGRGPCPAPGWRASIQYRAWLADGKPIEDRSRGEPLTFRVGSNRTIAGVSELVCQMRVSGRARARIPFELGYGEQGVPEQDVPGRADLLFDLRLVAIEPPVTGDTVIGKTLSVAVGRLEDRLCCAADGKLIRFSDDASSVMLAFLEAPARLEDVARANAIELDDLAAFVEDAIDQELLRRMDTRAPRRPRPGAKVKRRLPVAKP